MANCEMHRKVLVVGEDYAIKNLLTLAKKLDSQRVVARSEGLDLSTINRKQFDTAILDLRCSNRRPAGREYGMGEVWPSMVGRVLILNAEIYDRETIVMVERYVYYRRSLKAFFVGLVSRLLMLPGRSPSTHRA